MIRVKMIFKIRWLWYKYLFIYETIHKKNF